MAVKRSLLVKLTFLVLFSLSIVCEKTRAKDDLVWFVGYEKIDGACMPVGGSTKPGVSPFPYASMDDCGKDNVTENFDKDAKLQNGVILDNGECLKAWARAKINPFVYTNLSDCEKEKESMKASLAKSKTKRQSGPAPLDIAKTVVDTVIAGASVAFPPIAILGPIINLFWPPGESVWDQVKNQVKHMINQKMNEAYAKDLEQFLVGLKGEMEAYNRYTDSHSQKRPKLTTIDTNLGIKEPKFMDKADPISTLTYYAHYVSTRILVKLELLRLAPPSEKQHYVNENLEMLKRLIPYAGQMVYKELMRWRRSQLKCSGKNQISRYGYVMIFTFTDQTTGVTKRNRFNSMSWSQCKSRGDAWCLSLKRPIIDEVERFISKMRENIKTWATMFNTVATNPFVKGFSAADSLFTTDEGYCKFPFTYSGRQYTKCTTAGRGRHWCEKKGGGWGYCMAVGKMRIDLTSCKMPTSSSEQYFGHKNVPDSGRPCKMWKNQGRYFDFPMDGQSRDLASNYCRRIRADTRPWCYTLPSGYSYCSIRDCTSADWAL